MERLIVLYDVPGRAADKPKAWGPNTWKARFSLNYKGLPYRTEWVEYPDVEAAAKKIGAKPCGTRSNGDPLYTVPMIYDPSTKAIVADSFEIALYLDKTYPDTPKLFPPGSHALIAAFLPSLTSNVNSLLFQGVILSACHYLNDRSSTWFRCKYETAFGKKLEDFAPPGEVGDQTWKNIEEGYSKLASWLDKNERCDKGSLYPPFVMGDTPSFADVMIASGLRWAKTVLGEDSERWKQMREWDSGRWAAVSDFWDKYTAIH